MAKEFAIKTMTGIAKLLAEGKVERSNLGRVRGKMLADGGFPPQARGAVRRRPTAAVAAELPTSKAYEEDDESEAVDAADGQSEAEAGVLESASLPPSRKRPAAAVDEISSPTRKALAPPPPSYDEVYGL